MGKNKEIFKKTFITISSFDWIKIWNVGLICSIYRTGYANSYLFGIGYNHPNNLFASTSLELDSESILLMNSVELTLTHIQFSGDMNTG